MSTLYAVKVSLKICQYNEALSLIVEYRNTKGYRRGELKECEERDDRIGEKLLHYWRSKHNVEEVDRLLEKLTDYWRS